jgi:hypothetical protein
MVPLGTFWQNLVVMPNFVSPCLFWGIERESTPPSPRNNSWLLWSMLQSLSSKGLTQTSCSFKNNLRFIDVIPSYSCWEKSRKAAHSSHNQAAQRDHCTLLPLIVTSFSIGSWAFHMKTFVDGHRALLLRYRAKDSSPTGACCCCTHPGLANRTMLASHVRSTSLQLGGNRSQHREKKDEGWAWRWGELKERCVRQIFIAAMESFMFFIPTWQSYILNIWHTMGVLMVLAPLHRGPSLVFSPPANDRKIQGT